MHVWQEHKGLQNNFNQRFGVNNCVVYADNWDGKRTLSTAGYFKKIQNFMKKDFRERYKVTYISSMKFLFNKILSTTWASLNI